MYLSTYGVNSYRNKQRQILIKFRSVGGNTYSVESTLPDFTQPSQACSDTYGVEFILTSLDKHLQC